MPPPPAPAALHLKMATTGDIENDGDLDIWVESDGGHKMHSHFAVNGGDGTFTLDAGKRATDLVHHNYPAVVVALPRGSLHGRRPRR